MSTRAQDARHLPLSDVDKLRQDAARAAQVRALTTHPDVVALRTERIRSQVDALMWAGLLLGLAFTMVNVQTFAAEGAAVGSLAWCAAWLLDPMVSLVLVAVLRAEQVTARYQVQTGPWVRRTKVFAFAATYTMNTWQSWAALHLAGIVLHSVPPAMVYLAAETGPILRDRLTEAVLRAARTFTVNTPAGVHDSTAGPSMNGAAEQPVNAPGPVHDTPAASIGEPRRTRSRTTARRPVKAKRKLLADYLTEARTHLTPGVVPTPAWVRQVLPDCARGTSQNVADALKAELVLHADSDADQEGRAA
ncbi:MAG: hypothetical protein ACJ72N_21065 [Labedaea sp.]